MQRLVDAHAPTEKAETKEETRARLREEIAETVKDVDWFEAVAVLISAINDVSVSNDHTATVNLRNLISVEGAE